MSGPDPQRSPDDRELEDFLAGRGPHVRRYREAAQERSPPALDAAVLAQAEAAELAPAPRLRRAPGRWRMPLSLAATLVLGVGLVSRVQQESATPVAAQSAPEATQLALDAQPAAPLTNTSRQLLADPLASGEVPAVSEASAPATEPEQRVAHEREAAAGSDRPRVGVETAMVDAMAATVAQAPPPPPVDSTPPKPSEAPVPAAGAAASVAASPRPAAAMSFAPPPENRHESLKAIPAAPMVKRQSPPTPSSDVAEVSALRFAAGHYRSEFDHQLELFADGRYRLSDAVPEGGLPPQTGRRRAEGEGERLLPETGDAGCEVRLEPVGEAIRLRADCVSDYVGSYWREIE